MIINNNDRNKFRIEENNIFIELLKKRKVVMPEILAPVRDRATLVAAINSGADSVYFGLGELNMRASSKGIKVSELEEVVEYAHQRNVKVYVTLNVIIYENELKKCDEILLRCKKAKVDAIICWDFSVIEKCKNIGIPFHISTQASISNSRAAKFYENLGASCIVLARECTLKQIEQIRKKIKTKLEIFIHGAMCVSISGRCFISQFLNCKSANRGECLQPCRREYIVKDKETGYELELENHFVMSPKDLCTLGIIDKIMATGVDILKIEGRSRSIEYVSKVVEAYKTAINYVSKGEYNNEIANKLINSVSKVYNREFSEGFLFGMPGVNAWAKVDGNISQEKKEYVGKVVNYYPKSKIVYINVISNNIQLGDKVYIQGKTTGLVETTINELRSDDKIVSVVERGEATFPINMKVRQNDLVFRVRRNIF
jgi:putative protease